MSLQLVLTYRFSRGEEKMHPLLLFPLLAQVSGEWGSALPSWEKLMGQEKVAARGGEGVSEVSC